MKYYSTRDRNHTCDLVTAVVRGLAPDGGLYMPERIEKLPKEFFNQIENLSPLEICYQVAAKLFGEDVPEVELRRIVEETISFPVSVEKVEDSIFAMELYHGPTLAFKDFGARFMSRLLRYIVGKRNDGKTVNVLVATSGDTGSAVANGFLGIKGTNLVILYPSGKVSAAQEAQFTTLGQNITALEVEGSFDDCQRIVKEAFNDPELNQKYFLTSANSINIARLLPQTFYYFLGYKILKSRLQDKKWVVSVPSGNFGNLMAGMIAWKMGLPVDRFIAANNRNKVVYDYLAGGEYMPCASVETVANAMDVGNPSNFERLKELLGSRENIGKLISAEWFDDTQIKNAIKECYEKRSYLMDPHGACAYLALKESLNTGETGTFLETAHPSKFMETIKEATGKDFELDSRIKEFMKRERISIKVKPDLKEIKELNVLK